MNSLWSCLPNNLKHSYFENFEFFRNANDFHKLVSIYLVENGSFEFKIGNGEWDVVSKNQAVICPPYVNFSKKVKEKVTMHIVYFSIESSETLPTGKFDFDFRISDDLKNLKLLACQNDIPTENYRKHLISDIWFNFLSKIQSPYTEYKTHSSDGLFIEMINFIDGNLDTSLDNLAKAFNTSRVAVNNRFRKNTGKSVGNYIQELRIKKACKLIEETNYPLKYIAPACGFSNEYYFSSVFTKITGITPAKYRKKFLLNN